MEDLEIQICRAEEKDWPYICQKLKNYLLDASNADWSQFFVLKNGGKTVAFARMIDHGEYLEFASLGVDYYHRKKGLGTKMLKFLIQEAKESYSLKPIYSVTHRPEFIGSVGFEEVDSYPEYLQYKRKYRCKLDESRIKIMRYNPQGIDLYPNGHRPDTFYPQG